MIEFYSITALFSIFSETNKHQNLTRLKCTIGVGDIVDVNEISCSLLRYNIISFTTLCLEKKGMKEKGGKVTTKVV